MWSLSAVQISEHRTRHSALLKLLQESGCHIIKRSTTGYIRIRNGKPSNTHAVQLISLMDLFIEAGFDIINPVQINASGMDPVRTEEKIRRQDCFLGRRC